VCTVHVFALKVKRQKEHRPEKGQREVQWMSRTKAAKSVGDPMLGKLIRTLTKRPVDPRAPRRPNCSHECAPTQTGRSRRWPLQAAKIDCRAPRAERLAKRAKEL
jgi:hypothetical protein